MLKGYRIAVVEDDEFMGSSLTQRLELEGAEVVWLRQIARAIGALRTPPRPIDAVVCDIRLPDGTGEELYTRLCETTTPPPFLFVTGHGGIEQAVRLMRAGAADYVTKPFDIATLLDRLAAMLAQTEEEEEFPALLGISPVARRIEELAGSAAEQGRSVLVLGRAGTGKGLLARRIHDLSDRRAAPFVAVNLAREPDGAAALLGPGGAIDQTGEGTLYIHGIERLEKRAVAGILARLGGGFAGRIIASTDPEAIQRLAPGESLSELIYRLDAVEIAVPPLSERPEDAVWLMTRLFPKLNARRPQPLEGISGLTEEAVRAHSWPGGGRELRARMASGVASAPGPLLQPSDLFAERAAEGSEVRTLAEAREAAERREIVRALERTGGSIGEAAKLLKVSRTTLWEKMQKLGIRRGNG